MKFIDMLTFMFDTNITIMFKDRRNVGIFEAVVTINRQSN